LRYIVDIEEEQAENIEIKEKVFHKTKLDKFVDFIIFVEKKDLRLKFFFDNIRNYGLVAILFVAGKFLYHTDKIEILTGWGNTFFAFILIAYGFVLFILNAIQPIYILVKFKKDFNLNMLSYLMLSTLILLSGYALFFSFLYLKASL